MADMLLFYGFCYMGKLALHTIVNGEAQSNDPLFSQCTLCCGVPLFS